MTSDSTLVINGKTPSAAAAASMASVSSVTWGSWTLHVALTVLALLLERVAEHLVQLASDGYSKPGIRRHLQAVDRFGCWLAMQGTG